MRLTRSKVTRRIRKVALRRRTRRTHILGKRRRMRRPGRGRREFGIRIRSP